MNPKLYPIICANIIIMCRAVGADIEEVVDALEGKIWTNLLERNKMMELIIESQVELMMEDNPDILKELQKANSLMGD